MAPGNTSGSAVRVCALLTTFNRRETTLACLRALEAGAGEAGIAPAAIVVDDGSSDGTAAAVRAAFAWAEVVDGAGELFWCRGMHRAFATALGIGFDHYLWLNDDTVLAVDAVRRLLDCHADLAATRSAPVLVVGATVDAQTGLPTYGGERIPARWRPLRIAMVAPAAQAQACDSMTGNIVLIPAAAAARAGNLDPTFEHAMGDTDYALRARRAGVEIWLAPGVLGACSQNGVAGSYRDATLPLRARWRQMLSRKGLPWRSWLLFSRRHGGVLWPLWFAWPYLKVTASSLLGFAGSIGRRR